MRPDKSWSLSDCLSFVVMERRQLTEALTTDRRFEQAGMKVMMLQQPALRA
jgi:predicted nucleic acid-binding protein